jgi:hypothetical protein
MAAARRSFDSGHLCFMVPESIIGDTGVPQPKFIAEAHSVPGHSLYLGACDLRSQHTPLDDPCIEQHERRRTLSLAAPTLQVNPAPFPSPVVRAGAREKREEPSNVLCHVRSSFEFSRAPLHSGAGGSAHAGDATPHAPARHYDRYFAALHALLARSPFSKLARGTRALPRSRAAATLQNRSETSANLIWRSRAARPPALQRGRVSQHGALRFVSGLSLPNRESLRTDDEHRQKSLASKMRTRVEQGNDAGRARARIAPARFALARCRLRASVAARPRGRASCNANRR